MDAFGVDSLDNSYCSKTSISFDDSFITPSWPAPQHIKAYTTTRLAGVSESSFSSFNLAEHVDDRRDHVCTNRSILKQRLSLPSNPQWLTQVHGVDVIAAQKNGGVLEADASYTDKPEVVCSILTADCLPVLLTNKKGSFVAAVHAGWRGLAAGVLEKAVATYSGDNRDLLVWFGPAIGASKFEVGQDVYDMFAELPVNNVKAFVRSEVDRSKWLADLYYLACCQLNAVGVTEIYGGDFCTYSEVDKFFSYRRDGATGRMATLIWIE